MVRVLKNGGASQIISSTPATPTIAIFSIAGRTGSTGPRPRTMPTAPMPCSSAVHVSAQVRMATVGSTALPSAAWSRLLHRAWFPSLLVYHSPPKITNSNLIFPPHFRKKFFQHHRTIHIFRVSHIRNHRPLIPYPHHHLPTRNPNIFL